jgi:enoyl-CoA hydratase
VPIPDEFETIIIEREPPVSTITLNRPAKLNALTSLLLGELSAALSVLEADDQTHVVMIRGAGRAFSSGYDLESASDDSTLNAAEWRSRSKKNSRRLADQLWSYPKPTIAVIHGYCLGAACGLAALCDLTIAAQDCMIGEPEVRFGTASPILVLPWHVPMKVAKELLYTGKHITAQRACELGLVNEVVPNDELSASARRAAELVAKVPQATLRLLKDAINQSYEIMGFTAALDSAANIAAIIGASRTQEFQEFERVRLARGLKAALESRDEHPDRRKG